MNTKVRKKIDGDEKESKLRLRGSSCADLVAAALGRRLLGVLCGFIAVLLNARSGLRSRKGLKKK